MVVSGVGVVSDTEVEVEVEVEKLRLWPKVTGPGFVSKDQSVPNT